jgi:hypothetical protein
MSVNRSVQAAQRRRATPQPPTPPSSMQNRGPQPSINSAQAFVNQSKNAPAPKLPLGKMSAQQLSQGTIDDTSNQGIASISKMTIAQAITLITLRLGKVETHLANLALESSLNSNTGYQMTSDGQNGVLVDKSVIESMNSRLESLEKRSSNSSGPEVALLKQQLEGLKPVVSQNKIAIGAVIKDLTNVKTNLTSLINEFGETKELVTALQNLTMDNSQKIMDLNAFMGHTEEQENYNQEEVLEDMSENLETNEIMELEKEDTELVGTDLKNLIEQELAESS